MNCPYCQKEAPWVSNELRYGKRYGKSYMCYWCKDCDAYVGCHNNTRKALGTLANKELREWRMKAHEVLDELWKRPKNGYARRSVYIRLKEAFGREIHVGEADIETCKEIIRTVPLIFQK